MSFRLWLKVNAADKILATVRDQLRGKLESGSTVLEVGSGTGDFLIQSAPKISYGCGVDIDQEMINYSVNIKEKHGIDNVDFICADIGSLKIDVYDIATSTLCLHEMNDESACEILELMASKSSKVLIADYTAADGFLQKISIEFDELISGHYSNYKKYRKSGDIPGYADRLGLVVVDTIRTKIDGISIWVIDGKGSHNK